MGKIFGDAVILDIFITLLGIVFFMALLILSRGKSKKNVKS